MALMVSGVMMARRMSSDEMSAVVDKEEFSRIDHNLLAEPLPL